jgi:Tn3 transposase DDE domain
VDRFAGGSGSESVVSPTRTSSPEWLVVNVTQAERSPERVRDELLVRCREERIEPPSDGRIRANAVIFYGKGGDLASNHRDEQEMSVLCLRILQAALVYVNTLMLQDLLAEPDWDDVLTPEDRRGLTPLFWSHVLPLSGHVTDSLCYVALVIFGR